MPVEVSVSEMMLPAAPAKRLDFGDGAAATEYCMQATKWGRQRRCQASPTLRQTIDHDRGRGAFEGQQAVPDHP